MTPAKPLPSDEERAESVAGEHGALCVNPLSDPANERCTCPRRERIASVATLLRQVRAEASQEAYDRGHIAGREKSATARENKELRDMLEAAEAERDALRVQLAERHGEAERALRDLTPGGSEFQTPEECVAFVQADRESLRRTIKAFKRQADALREENARLKAALRDILEDAGDGGTINRGLNSVQHAEALIASPPRKKEAK